MRRRDANIMPIKTMAERVTFRKPEPEDGARVWALIQQAGTLDVNSAYCYVMLCDYFRDTCVVAELEGRLVGFVSAFIHPAKPETLFIWQIAVADNARGRGIGRQLLESLIDPIIGSPIQHLELTISPDNRPSRSLFMRLAKRYSAEVHEHPGYPETWFPIQHAHAKERLYRIGPLTRQADAGL